MIGWGLVLIGSYSLLKILVPRFIPGAFFEGYMQTVIVAIVLIVVGVRVLQPKKTDNPNSVNSTTAKTEIHNPAAYAYDAAEAKNRTTGGASNGSSILDIERSIDSHDQ
jgi:hypothetical protein